MLYLEWLIAQWRTLRKTEKQISTVPRVWVNEGTLYWPSNKKKTDIFYKNCEPPKIDWYQIHKRRYVIIL